MTDKTVIAGVYVDCRFMPGLKSARISIDIPIEHSNDFLRAFGAPDRANPAHVAIALMEPVMMQGAPKRVTRDPVSHDKQHTPLCRSQKAAVMIKENKDFRAWLVDTYWTGKEEVGDYDGLLKKALGITSKSELDVDGPKADAWDKLLTSYDVREMVR